MVTQRQGPCVCCDLLVSNLQTLNPRSPKPLSHWREEDGQPTCSLRVFALSYGVDMVVVSNGMEDAISLCSCVVSTWFWCLTCLTEYVPVQAG